MISKVSSFSFQYLTIKPNYAELCIPVTMPFFTVYGQKKSSINQWVNDTWSVWTSLARNDWLNWFPQVLLEYCLTDIFITWPKGNNSQYGIWKMLHAKLICYCCRINKKEDITLLVKIGEQSRVIFQGIVSFVRSTTRCHLIPELFGPKAKKPATCLGLRVVKNSTPKREFFQINLVLHDSFLPCHRSRLCWEKLLSQWKISLYCPQKTSGAN